MNFFKFKNRNFLKVIITMALISIFTTVTVFATPVEIVQTVSSVFFSDFTERPLVQLIETNGIRHSFSGTGPNDVDPGAEWFNYINYISNPGYLSISPGSPLGWSSFQTLAVSSGGTLSSKGSVSLVKGSKFDVMIQVFVEATNYADYIPFNFFDFQPYFIFYTNVNRTDWVQGKLTSLDEGMTYGGSYLPSHLVTMKFSFTLSEDVVLYGYFFKLGCQLYATHPDISIGSLTFRLYDFNSFYEGPDYIVQVSPPPSIDQAIFEEYEASLLEGSRELLSSHTPDFNLNLSSFPKLASSMLGFSYLIENLYNIDFIRVLFYFSVGLGGVGFLIGLAQHAVGSLGSYTSKSNRSSKANGRKGG